MPSTSEDIRRAAGIIRRGGLVAFPTETVYGLGANALDPEAVHRIFVAKGRPSTNPLIVHVADIEMAKSIATNWPAAADSLAQRFWPGPLTLVLTKRTHVPDLVTAGLPTVGIRVPAHPVALALIREAGVPVAAPSANRFTQLSPTTAEHVRAGLGDQVDFILDGGPCQVGIESTVLSLAGPSPILLRPGMIAKADLEAVIGPVRAFDKTNSPSQPEPSPGLHPRHYSPRTRLILGDPPAIGRGAVIVPGFDKTNSPHPHVYLPNEPAGYAVLIYRTLHDLDQQSLDWIAVQPPPDTPAWSAILDRLRRAATPPSPEPA